MKRFLCLLAGHKYIFSADDDSGICRRCRHRYFIDTDRYKLGFIRKNRHSFREILFTFFFKM